MRHIYMLPLPSHAREDEVQSINQIVLHLNDHLPAYGYQLTEIKSQADLIAGHAGTPDNETIVDVAHLSGLYPTAYAADSSWQWSINARVIETCRHAAAVTVPSNWVGEILQRDMGFSPDVISWGIDTSQWQPAKEHGSYVLWAKPRSDSVCDPEPMVKLAAICPQQLFLTTFLHKEKPNEQAAAFVTPNIRAIGRVPLNEMRGHVARAQVFMSSTKETFCLGVLEAMACGVPVLAYNDGAVPDIVRHGIEGFIVERGDIEGLKKGLEYCIKHRAILGANGIKRAKEYTWDRCARAIAGVYDRVLADEPRPHVIDESLYVV